MATAAELAALATAINVQAPAALVEALREIQRLRDENQRIHREYLALKVCELRGDVYVNRNLNADLRYPITWAEAAEDLGAEAEMAWEYADRLKDELDELKERASGLGGRPEPPTEAPRGGEQLASGKGSQNGPTRQTRL